MSKTRLIIDNACYHIFSRGNQQQKIFIDENDFKFYLFKLQKYKRKFSFLLYGYCLMPNHVHLIGQPVEPDKLSTFMQCLQRCYTAYYNGKYEKVGHLWQNRFKTKVITKDQYLIDCISYVELNPIRANLTDSPLDYKFSSYLERNLSQNEFNLLDKFLL